MPLLLALRPRLPRSLAALLVPLALAAAGCIAFTGNGDVEVEEREHVGFDAVVNATSLDVEITIGEADGVRVLCDSNLLGRVDTHVEDGVLRIVEAGLLPLRPRGDCRVEVDAGHLRAVHNRGSGEVRTSGTADELTEIHQLGSGLVAVEELTAATVDVRQTGSGSVHLAGTVGDAAYVNTGSGNIHARDLLAETVQARGTGSGDLELFASEVVDAEVVGSGDIHVWGDPADRAAHHTGSGDVVFH
ncbi:head GIN domain-containing protein [Nannocystis radixulma]|uniref:DUF2807 domain-containing protein n=1 Tax=Nannocystis radixulma TaxID=2995305 RepID=A0ABT5B4Q4_9BACT|nr:head GIN domain-containing protein [Nannocystis radixulma]MDC0669072.1 DUF2807 domain-containing protein [Nannocystis radixulma]